MNYILSSIFSSNIWQYVVIGVLATCIVLAVILFSINYHHQIKVSLLMDNETGVFNKDGLTMYYNKNGKRFTNPAILVVELRNLGFIYSNYEMRIKLMYQITDCMCKGLSKLETVGRVEFNKFILVLDNKNREECILWAKEIENRLENVYFENYGVYNFSPLFALCENADLSKGDDITYESLAILEYSTIREGNIYFYSQEVSVALERMLSINSQKDEALANNRFVSYIQPKVDVKTGKIVGGEALCRWVDDNQVVLYHPGEFIRIFERNGFIKKIEMVMLENACQLLADLKNKGRSDLTISVNISKMNFESPSFLSELQALTNKYGVNPANLELEITETITMTNLSYVSSCITSLHQYGYKVAMDDFGKEYSSLSTLVNNMFDTIKIDGLFFKNDLISAREKEVVKNIVRLLSKCECEVVCEGVETMETIKYLGTISHDLTIQGYVFAKPMPVFEFMSFLEMQFDIELPPVEEEGGTKVIYKEVPVQDNIIYAQTRDVSLTEDAQRVAMLQAQAEVVRLRNELTEVNNNMHRIIEEQREREHQAELERIRKEMEDFKNATSNEDLQRSFEIELQKKNLVHQTELDKLNREITDLNHEKDGLIRERDDLSYQRDNLIRERDDLNRRLSDSKREIEDLRSNSTNTADLDRIRERAEEEKRRLADDFDREKRSLTQRYQDEIDQLRRQLNNQMYNNQMYPNNNQRMYSERDYEIERLRREIDDLKSRNTHGERNYEIDFLRHQIDELYRNQGNNQNNGYQQPPYPYYQNQYQQPQQSQQQIDVDALIRKLKEENEKTFSKYAEDTDKRFDRLSQENDRKFDRLSEENRKHNEEIRQNLEKERQNIEEMLSEIGNDEEEEEKTAVSLKQIEDEQREANKRLSLSLDDLSDDDDDEEEDDDDDDDSENEAPAKVEKPTLTLEEVESIIKSYQQKYTDEWNKKAREELKDGYYEVINGLRYYRGKVKKNLAEKIKSCSKEQKTLYNIVKNEFMKYNNVEVKLTNSYEQFYVGKKQIGKIALSKTKIRVYLALDPAAFSQSQFPHKDLSNKKVHVKTPYYTMIKSNLSVKRLKYLISELMLDNKTTENQSYSPVDYANMFKYYRKDRKNK